jgi:hypothetical protein
MKRWIVPLVLGLAFVGAAASRAMSSDRPITAASGGCEGCPHDHCPLRH